MANDDDVLGALLPTSTAEYKPLLEGLGPDKVVAVFNPLNQDFRVQYARAIAETGNLSDGMKIARDRAGLDLSKEQGIQGHAVQFHVLKAGRTENLPGDIAQVAVRQLVNYILVSRPGKGSVKMVADPQSRKQVEAEVVKTVTDLTVFTNQQVPELDTEPEDSTDDNPPPGTGKNYDPDRTSAKAAPKT